MKRNMAVEASAGAVSQAAQTCDMDHHHNRGPRRSGATRGSLQQMGGVGMLQRNAEAFDLSPTQLDSLDALRVEFECEKVDLRAAMRKCKIHLQAAMCHDDPVEQDVKKAIDEVAKCESALRLMAFQHLQGARAVLDETQCQKVKTFRRQQECQ